MAESGRDEIPATKKEWVVPVARDIDLGNEKPWAIRALYDLLGWKTTRNANGKFDVDQESIGPEIPQE